MALAEQDSKRQKLFEPQQQQQQQQQSFMPVLSQDEILRKRRNRDEIKSLYDCYRRIKFCISQKDARLMPDFEQAYLSLITASRGCTSVQRIVAELIPRYASNCPTALEAAAKVAINMYNWSYANIIRGEDSDGVGFQTAKACIFGLVDICGIASSKAPTSSVIRGICSAVFLNVLTFFVSSFEGKDIYEIGNGSVATMCDSELFSDLKQEVAEEENALSKLFKFRALSLLRIFFCYPKILLGACFETLRSTETDAGSYKCGIYFLRQVTSQVNTPDFNHVSDKTSHDEILHTVSVETIPEGVDSSVERTVSDGNENPEDISVVIKNCLAGKVLSKDPSLRDWFALKYKKLCKSVDPQILSEISSALEEAFGPCLEQIKEADSQEDSDEESSDPSKYIDRQYLMPRISNQVVDSSELSERDQPAKSSGLGAPLDPDAQLSNEKSNDEFEGSQFIKDTGSGEQGGSCHFTSSMRKALVTSGFPSPANRTPGELKNVPNAFASPEQHSYRRSNSFSSNQISWFFDGDSANMDVFSASKQLWLGSLGPDASESLVKFQFEKFGPVELFLYFPIKGFALVEYRNIMDAIKAREYMRGASPWGACLQVKFQDSGLGSRGSINGVAVGSSTYVYVGNVSCQWIKDEILHGLMRGGFRHPRIVSDLSSESALLMEFETAEEATTVMTHLRQLRRENGYRVPINKSLTPKADVSRSYMDSARYFPASIHQEFRINNSGSISNSMVGSPHVPPAFDSPMENFKMRMSQLSSLLLSLSSKYNISQNPFPDDNNISRRYNATTTRDEDKVPTNTLWMGLPDISSPMLTDDELMAVCNHAVGNAGTVARLTRANMQMGCSWFVEFSSVDAAATVMKNLRSCPGMFFQIEFSKPGNTLFINKSERSSQELVSPRMELEKRGSMAQGGHALQSNWTSSGGIMTPEVGARNIRNFDGYDNNLTPQAKSHTISHANQEIWTYNKPGLDVHFSAPGSMQCPPTGAQGLTVMPPQQIQASSVMRPVYYIPNNSWGTQSASHPLPLSHISPTILPNNLHVAAPPPFLPASVTPLAQLTGSTIQHHGQMVGMPVDTPMPPPTMQPPFFSSPPPLPVSQPPMVPPPPSSPPPLQSAIGPSSAGNAGEGLQYPWQGVLCKSGVHYCKIYAHKEDSVACKYSNAISEPIEWPARLDVTKRTDFQHVRSTFTSTPPHKREVCRLFPFTSEDNKGFQDFISYLKQRECAGVIKIPAVKNMWARLLFILPHSHDICSMLTIAPHPSECLFALILPKETQFEWV